MRKITPLHSKVWNRLLALFFLLALSPFGWGQIINESCASATDGWTFTNVGGQTIQQAASGGYWLIDFIGDEIITTTLDVSSYTDLTLEFKVATYGSGTNHAALVEYSTDNGTTWSTTTFTTAIPTSSTFITSGTWNIGTLNTTELKLRFTSPSGGSKGVRIDNILLSGTLLDITAPIFTATYPSAGNILTNSFDLAVNLDEIGTAYYVVLADRASVPSPLKVKAGTYDDGTAAIVSGSINVLAATTDYTVAIAGLTAYTDYDVYVVAEDDESSPNLQAAATLVEVITLPLTPPTLTADNSDNNVDNNLEITFTDNATWRSAITAVKVNAGILFPTDDFTIGAGVITLIAGSDASLTTSGTKTITVIAETYSDATVSQEILAGAFNTTNSSLSINQPLALSTTSTITLTAKDQYNNLIENYVAKFDLTITDAGGVDESYNVTGTDYTASASDVAMTATNASGISAFDVVMPAAVDGGDGVSVQVQLNDGTTSFGSAYSYSAPLTPTLNMTASLTEENMNGATISLTLLNETFANETLDKANFTLNNAPVGVTANSVTYNSTTSATITLDYDGTDFDANVTTFSVTVTGVELTSGNPLSSNDITITATVETAPEVTTDAAITTNGFTTATWGGDITNNGGETITEKGFCWNTTGTPTTADSKKTDASGGTEINVDIDGLAANTLYYVRAYATNSLGTSYGAERSFTTLAYSTEAEITAFSFSEQTGPATINSGAGTINIQVAHGTSLLNLVATFTLSDGANATVTAAPQISNSTSNDFSSAVTYHVTAQDGITTKDWVVTVSVYVLSSDATVASTYYSVDNGLETISNVPYQTTLADFESRITPAALATFEVYKADGTTVATDLADGYKVIVTAEDLSTKTYTISVNPKDLFFSEYIEGGSNNKAVEIYNPTNTAIDLSLYTVKLGGNGGSWGAPQALSGNLLPGYVYVIVNTGSTATILAEKDIESSITFFNGDDALGLFKNDVLIDAFGTYLNDPGTAWNVAGTVGATLNHTLVRKTSVQSGNTNWTAQAGTNTTNSEWEVFPQDDFTYIGWHIAQKPELVITNPKKDSVLTTPNVDVTFTLQRFTTNVDGHVMYSVDGGAASYTDVSPISLTGLTGGAHTISLELVDMSNASLDPAFIKSVDITADLSTDATLSELKVDDILVPAFDPATLTYNMALAYGTVVVPTVTYSLNDLTAHAVKTDALSLPGSTTIVVTAEDGTTVKTYTINFTITPASTDASVTSLLYTVNQGLLTITGVPYNESLIDFESGLTPAPHASFDTYLADGTTLATTDIMTGYKVIGLAQDGVTTKTYVVTKNSEPAHETDITAFSLPVQTGAAIIDNVAHTIGIEVAYGTDVTNLVATFTLSLNATAKVETTAQVTGVTANNFTNPVVYTVTAEDAVTTQDWTVTVTIKAPNTDATLSDLKVDGTTVSGFDPGTFTYGIELMYGTSIVPTVTYTKNDVTATANQLNASSLPGATTVTVTAQDGTTEKVYTINFTLTAASTDATVSSLVYTVSATDITNVPFGTTLVDFKANLTPATDATFEVYEADGITVAGDLASGYKVIVTAQDGITTKTYTVLVNADVPLLLTEDFEYSTGQLTSLNSGADVSGGNWINYSGTALPITVTSGSLSYDKYLSSDIGNKVDIQAGSAEDAYRQFETQTEGSSVYASFILNLTSTGSLAANSSTTGDYSIALLPSSTTSALVGRVSVRAGSVANTFNIGLRISSSNAAASFLATDYPINTPVLVVLNYQIVAGNTNDVAKMWVNPVVGPVEPTEDVSQTSQLAADPTDIARIGIRQGTNTVTGQIDGIRIAKTWDEAVKASIDNEAPVAAFSPVNGTTNVDETSNVTLTFDEDILNASDGSTITNGDLAAKLSFFETATPANIVAFDATIVDKVVTVNPNANLKLGIEYTLSLLANSVEDASGNENTVSSSSFTIRPAHTDATLSDLKVSGTTVEGFVATTFDYTVTLPFGTTEVPVVIAITNDTKAVAVVTPASNINSLVASERTTTITVTAENETIQVYTVLFNVTPGLTGKNILTYSFAEQTSAATIGDGTIAVEVTASTDRSALVASFTISEGATIAIGGINQTSGTTANNFTVPVTYVVTAQDGTTKDWVVTVTNAVDLSNETDILTFQVSEVDGIVNSSNHTVTITLPYGVSRSNLVATYSLSAGASAKVGADVQVNGVTANNFTNPVVYTIIAEDGTTSQDWNVSVGNEDPKTDATLSDLKVDGITVDGFVASTLEYTLNYPYGTTTIPSVTYTVNDATASVVFSEATIMPGTTSVEVTAQDGTTKMVYQIHFVWDDPSTEAFVTSTVYTVDGLAGTITNIPYNVSLATFKANLTPALHATFNVFESDSVSLAISLASGQKVIVTAQDNLTKKVYTITVNEAPVLDLFFSEYIEGSSNNKAIEIFNPTNTSIDLSNYVIKASNNGLGWGLTSTGADTRYVLPLSGTLAPNDVYVITNSSASSTILALADLILTFNGTANGGNGNNVASFNGNDALGLFKNNVLIDVFGGELITTNFNVAGTSEAAKDHTILRKPTVSSGNINWTTSEGTNAENSEWIVSTVDDFTNLGTHALAVIDETAPLVSFNPENGATGVFISSSVTLTFNETVYKATDGSSFTDNEDVSSLIEFYESSTPANLVAFTATINGKVITIVPSTNLLNSIQYTVLLKAAVVEDKASNENELAQASFTTIDASVPVVSLIAPVGGETYYAGDVVNISWNSSNIANIKIEAYVPSNTAWEVLVASTDASDGSETINIPVTAAYATTYKIRISDASNAAVVDSSNAFTVIAVATDIAQLRLMSNGSIAKLSGKAVVTFTQSNRHQKFIQDATGAILIDDAAAKITTEFVVGDEMTGLEGSLTEYNGMKEFVPTKDPGAPTNSGLIVIPQVVAPDEFETNFETYESEVITFEGVKFTDADGTVKFTTGTSFTLSTGMLTANFYTNFYNADYIGSVLPVTKGNVTGIANSRATGNYITSRSAADMVFPSNVATLSDLKVDGTTISGFNPNEFIYTVEFNTSVTEVPVVTATATQANALVEVTNATAIPGITTVNVTAEDAETMLTYQVRFTYETLSNDATLNSLTVDGDTVNGFESGVYDYLVMLPYGTSSIPAIAGTASNSNATLIVTQATSLPGDATVNVIAEDQVTQLTYTVHLKVAPNHVATLSNLLVDEISIEGFNPEITSYIVAVASSALPVVSAVATDPNATIDYQQIAAIPDTAFVTVTAEDGINQKIYQVLFVDQDLSHDATLIDLTVDGTTISGFESSILEYNLVLPHGTTVVPVIAATPSNSNAVLTLTQAIALPGDATVNVIAEDGVNQKSYIIHFTVAPSSDATLSNLSVNSITVTGFNASVLEYSIILPYGTMTIPTVNATASDENASITIAQATELPGDASVVVIAEDGVTSLTYTVHFTVAPNSDATLSDLKVGSSTVTGFSASIVEYNIELPYNTTSAPEVTATATDVNADIIVSQATTLPGDATVVVTAEDGVTSLTYTVHFTLGAIPTFTVTFHVTDENSSTVSGANVQFNSENLLTNAEGNVQFTNVAPVTDAPFAVTKEGNLYEAYSGTVTVTDTDITIEVVLQLVGIAEHQHLVRNIFPNPTSGKFDLQLSENHTGSIVVITDLTGKIILNQEIVEVQTKIDLSGNKQGIYLIQVISGDQHFNGKIILY